MTQMHNDRGAYTPAEIEAAAQAIAASCEDCTCEDVLNQLFEMLDHELPPHEEERLRQHAQNCPHCTDASKRELSVRTRIRQSCVESAPSELRMRVVSQIVTLRTRRLS